MDENTVEQLIFFGSKEQVKTSKVKTWSRRTNSPLSIAVKVTLNLSMIQEVSQKIRADCRRQDKQNRLFRLTVLFCTYMYMLQVKFDFRLILI